MIFLTFKRFGVEYNYKTNIYTYEWKEFTLWIMEQIKSLYLFSKLLLFTSEAMKLSFYYFQV